METADFGRPIARISNGWSARLNLPSIQYDVIALTGGLNQITPTLATPAGNCRDAMNFEALEFGGYGRIGGYERYSGQPAPSSAAYAVQFVASYTNIPSVGQTLTNAGATATGYIIAVTATYIVYTKGFGAFNIGDTLKVGATVIGISIAPTTALSSKISATYTALAANVYRADITNPTGSGAIRGGFLYNDLNYCIRDNAGATASNLWQESSSGWVQVSLYNEIKFTVGGTAQPADGAILTQGAVTATVKRVVKQSGAWTGTAAGRFIITNPAGGNFSAGAATLTGGTTVTLTAIQTPIVLLPGGKGETVQANFYGQLSASRVYYADGVNRMFEFDGVTLVPLTTATLPDQPKHICAFKNHLFYSVQSSIFNSAIGDPYNYTALNGAAELACGDTVTGFLVQPGSQTAGSMSIHARNTTLILYGTSAANWNLVIYNNGVGALDYTAQALSQSYVMDDRGVLSLTASLNFGNFDSATITNMIRPFIAEKRTKVSYSSLDRSKSQYRIFFTDGSGLYITIVNGETKGCMPVMFPTCANVAWEGTKSNGTLVKFMGGTDGHVHQMDSGTSFDGASINAYITLNWDSANSPRMRKRYRRASVEASSDGYAEIRFGYGLGYASTMIPQGNAISYPMPFSPAYWDSFIWDLFVWDGKTLFPTECEMCGTAENVQLTLGSDSAEYSAYAINSIILHYSTRRGLR
jgi:hypothetical protein